MITPLQFAGVKPEASELLLPAATTTTVPAASAELIAFWLAVSQGPVPPRLRFSTRAGLGLAGTPGTDPPEAQTIASAMSDVYPPHLPRTRTGRILLVQLMPATPAPLLVAAPIVPDTCVPWNVLLVTEHPRK